MSVGLTMVVERNQESRFENWANYSSGFLPLSSGEGAERREAEGVSPVNLRSSRDRGHVFA